jgi:hypothetical protein
LIQFSSLLAYEAVDPIERKGPEEEGEDE